MKKIMKRMSVLFLAAFMLIFCVFAACDCGNKKPDPNTDPNPGEIVYSLSLDTTKKGIELMEEFYINAVYTEIPDTTLTFTSENESIATVEADGKVKGQGIGTTNIVATYGTAVQKCEVSVSILSEKPTIKLDGLNDFTKTVYLQDNQPFDLKTKVTFKGKVYDDAIVEYSISEDAGTIEDGKLIPTALAQGVDTKDAKLTIKATWRNANEVQAPTLTETVNVKIVSVASNDNAYLLVNNTLAYPTGYVLYKDDVVAGQNFTKTVPLVLRGIREGVALDDASNLSILHSTPGIVSVDGNTMTAVEVGTTNITISFADPLANPIDGIVSVTIPVEVKYPVVDMDADFQVGAVSKKDNYDMTAIQNFFNTTGADNPSDDEIKKVVVNYNEPDTPAADIYDLTINGTTLTGFIDDEQNAKDVDLVFMTDTYGYRFDATIYTDIITTQAEFVDAIKLKQVNTEFNYYGYQHKTNQARGSYLLTTDVHITDVWQQPFKGSYGWRSNSEIGFFGYIDGQGHKVTFDKIGSAGIFGIVGDGTVLKNLQIVVKAFDYSVACDGKTFTAKTSTDRSGNVILGVQIGTSGLLDNLTYIDSGAVAENFRPILPVKMENLAISLLPDSSNVVDGFDGIFAHIYSDLSMKNILVQINENVRLQNSQVGAADNFGILSSVDAGNVGAYENNIQRVCSNVVVVSPYKQLGGITTVDARNKVLDGGNNPVNPPAMFYNFYTVAESEAIASEEWYIDYMATLYPEASTNTNVTRFGIKNVSRYDNATKLIEANANIVGSWLVNADGTVTYQA